jgi:UDP-glucose 4-epimerase
MKVALVGSQGFFGTVFTNSWKSSGIVLSEFNRNNMPWKKNGELTEEFSSCEQVIWAATSLNPIIAETRSDLVEKELIDWHQMLNQLSSNSQVKSFIFLSSGGCVYTDKDGPFDEGMDATGMNKYGEMKAIQEALLLEWLPQSTVLRLSNLYGIGQPHGRGQGVIAEWAFALSAGRPLKIFGNMEATRDYLHIRDAVRAVENLLAQPLVGTYNVGSGTSTSLGEILELFKIYSRKPVDVDQRPGRSFDRRHYRLSIEKFQNRSSWVPKVSLSEGISEILEQSGC